MLLESKSLLAKLMATENLIIEQRKVSTAFFDTKNRVLVVPVLDNKIPGHTYDLFMGHEVGHALWTPADGQEIREKYSIPHGLANIVEDSRIERKIKYKYPGLKNSFVKGYNDLLERNFFDTKGIDIDTMKFIDRLNLHCKGGAILNIQFSEKELELVKAVESTETYEDVMQVCQKIIDFTKENMIINPIHAIMLDLSDEVEQFEEEETEENEETPGNGENVESEEDNGEETSSEEDDFEGTGEVSSESKEEKEEQTEEDDTIQIGSGDEGASDVESDEDFEDDISDLLDSHTDNAYRNNEYKLFDEDSIDYTYLNIPKLNVSDYVIDFKEVYEYYDEFANQNSWQPYPFYDNEGFVQLRREINSGVSYLVKEFEMRKSADQLKKASTAKTGDLNLSKIYSHRFNEDIFKRITVVPGAKSHGLVIFLDWSGSMTSHLQNTVKQLFNIVMFCKKVNIPYEVYTFTTPQISSHEVAHKAKNGEMRINDVKLLNVLSSRMNSAQFTKAASALTYMSKDRGSNGAGVIPYIFGMSGTPLNQTVVLAMEIVPEFKRKYGLQVVNTIFLTDGEGNCNLEKIIDEPGHYDVQIINAWNYSKKGPTRAVLRDPVSKHQEKIDMSSSRTITSAFIKLFKHRTGSNIVGFYILSPLEFKSYMHRHVSANMQEIQDIRAAFSKDHCAVIKNDGYDEYYLLRSKKGDSEEPELVIKENASAKSLASAFSKYNNKRSTNRIVLNRFISMIA